MRDNWLNFKQLLGKHLLDDLYQCSYCGDRGHYCADICYSCWQSLPHTVMPLKSTAVRADGTDTDAPHKDHLLSASLTSEDASPKTHMVCCQCALPLPVEEADAVVQLNSNSLTSARCGRCQRNPPALDYCIAQYFYKPPIAQWIRTVKDHNNLWMSHRLEQLLTANLSKPSVLPTLLIPVPSSRKHLWQRGFNLSELLAKRVADQLGCRIDFKLLQRTKSGSQRGSQRTLNRQRRQLNIRNTFRINKKVASIKNANLLLIDDVMTTGATLNEIARILKLEGCRSVGALVLARAI